MAFKKCVSEFEKFLYERGMNTAEVFKMRQKLSVGMSGNDPDRWKTNAEILFGFFRHGREARKVLARAPEVLELPPENLRDGVQAWTEVEGGRKVLLDCPEVLLSSAREAAGKLSALKEIFPVKKLSQLVRRNPAVISQPEEELRERYDYLVCRMGQTQHELLRSSALCYPLTHLETRHLAAEWAGVWKPMKVKTREQLTQGSGGAKKKSQKPDLDDLFATPDTDFCRSIVGIDEEEYSVFKDYVELMRMQRAVDEDVNEESDDEADGNGAEWRTSTAA